MRFPKISPRALLAALSLVCGVLGFGLVVWGVWLVHQPTAMVVAGLSLLAYAWRVDRVVSMLGSAVGGKAGG
ncbi:hypothetical protein [Comamonas kerstersii]